MTLTVASWPSAAAAAPYAVNLCTENAGHEGITISVDGGSSGLEAEDECGIDSPGLEGIALQDNGAAGSSIVGGIHWILNAPEGTSIQKLTGSRENGSPWDTDMVWTAFNGTVPFLDKVESVVPGRAVTYDVNASFFEATLQCTRQPCLHFSAGINTLVRLRRMTATMDDTAAPTASFDPPLGTTPVHGTIQIPVLARDKGAGISKIELLLDGARMGIITDDNGGKCGAAPFRFLVPCKLELNPSFPVDTTRFPVDASHTVEAVVTDASGQTGEAMASIDVHNAPTNAGAPRLSGQAKLGAMLTATSGKWDGPAPTFAFQWLRCEPPVKTGDEAGCTPISGATQDTYVPTVADVGKRDVAKVRATNAFGSATALSLPSDPVANSSSANPPQTKISKHPRKKTVLHLARFSFSADQPGSTFRCKLDKSSFKPCRSPFKRKVKPGRHSFRVRAVNSAGKEDPTPAIFRWKVSNPPMRRP